MESDDIHDLQGDDPLARTGEGAKDEGGMSPIWEGQQLHSIPDSEHTPSLLSIAPQVPITDPSAPRRDGSSRRRIILTGFRIVIFRYAIQIKVSL